jgi:hypothetical protein
MKKQYKAQKKTQATQKEKRMIAGLPVSFSDIPLTCRHPQVVSPNDKLAFFSSAKEKLKMLDFKSQKGMLSVGKQQCLAELHRVGGSARGGDLGIGP